MYSMSVNDQKYMARLMKKHGTNYLKMFRDIKLNDMQYEEERLKRMGTKFINLKENFFGVFLINFDYPLGPSGSPGLYFSFRPKLHLFEQ